MDIFLKKPDIPHFLKLVACFVFFKSVNILFLFIFLKSVFNKYVY